MITTHVLIHKHRTEGGTGITNFSPKHVRLYRDAIHYSKNSESLFVSDRAIENQAGATNLCSLHCLDTETCDLSIFWIVFDGLKSRPEYEYPGW